jgi:hypothetical protein
MLWFIFGCSGVVKKVRYKNVEEAVQFFLRNVCYNRSQKLCSLRVSTLMYLGFPPMMCLQQQQKKVRQERREREREEEELPDDLMN